MAVLKPALVLSTILTVLMVSSAPIVNVQNAYTPSGFNETLLRYDWNRTGATSASSNIITPHVRWTFATNGIIATGPITADVDRDGRMEIFLGEVRDDSEPRLMYSLDYNGGLLWTAKAKWDVLPTAVADLDHKGSPEVVFSEPAHGPVNGLNIYVFESISGTKIWNYTDHGLWEEGFAAGPIVYDVNGDGIDDLTLGSMDRYVYTFGGMDGKILWQSPAFEHYIRSASPFYDLDKDGENDFVVWDNHALTRVYSIKTHKLLWESRLGYGTAITPAIGELNGDGKPEIVFASVVSGGVRVLRADGSLVWANENYLMVYHSPTLVDVNSDGLLDIVIGDSQQHTITAFQGSNGAILWQTVLPATWSQAPLVSADIDGDKVMEILAGSDSGLHALDSMTGQIKWTFSVDKVRSEPRVADIDGDKKAEILFGAGDGKLYVLDQAPPPVFNPRTIGYWKHQCTIAAPKGDHVGMQQTFIDAIRGQSKVFSNLNTVKEACDILWADYRSDMAGRAKQQLLALWLNVVSGFVDPATTINLPKLTAAKTVGGAILDAENLILTQKDKPSLERAKNICDTLNNGIR